MSHTGFPLIPTSMTLNDLELIFRFSQNSIALLANYVYVTQCMVKDRPIMSVKYCLPVSVFHFWPQLITLQCGLTVLVVLSGKFPEYFFCGAGEEFCVFKREFPVALGQFASTDTQATFDESPGSL